MFNFFKKRREKPESFQEILDQFEDLKREFGSLSQKLEDLKKESKFFIQKVGIVRFNPFSEIGGNQSFSLALLDENNNGVVITSLYTREGNRVYGKPIKNGQSQYPLSEQEKEAIAKANYGNKDSKPNKESTRRGSLRPR